MVETHYRVWNSLCVCGSVFNVGKIYSCEYDYLFGPLHLVLFIDAVALGAHALNIAALFVLYLLQESKTVHKNKSDEQKIIDRLTNTQIVILCLAVVITLVGVPYQIYRDNTAWSLKEFVKGVPDTKCLGPSVL